MNSLIGRVKQITFRMKGIFESLRRRDTTSFDDAMKKGIACVQKILNNVRGAWIENQEVLLDEKGKITEYRVQLKVTFILEE